MNDEVLEPLFMILRREVTEPELPKPSYDATLALNVVQTSSGPQPAVVTPWSSAWTKTVGAEGAED
jgi:hypothetical protein